MQVHSELSGDIVVEDVEKSADDGSGGTQVQAHLTILARFIFWLLFVNGDLVLCTATIGGDIRIHHMAASARLLGGRCCGGWCSSATAT